MSFSVTGAHVCDLFCLFCLLVGQGLVAGLWILLATGVVPSYRGGLLANCRVVLAPDLHMQQIL